RGTRPGRRRSCLTSQVPLDGELVQLVSQPLMGDQAVQNGQSFVGRYDCGHVVVARAQERRLDSRRTMPLDARLSSVDLDWPLAVQVVATEFDAAADAALQCALGA